MKSVPRVSSGLGQVNFLSSAGGELCIRELPPRAALYKEPDSPDPTRPGPVRTRTRGEPGQAARPSAGPKIHIDRFILEAPFRQHR